MVNQSQVYVGLSLLGICSLVGAGVSIGSGVAMIAQEAVYQENQKTNENQNKDVKVASPFERRLVSNKGFAASVF